MKPWPQQGHCALLLLLLLNETQSKEEGRPNRGKLRRGGNVLGLSIQRQTWAPKVWHLDSMLGTQALKKNKWQLLGLCGPQSYFSCSVKGNLNFVSFFGNMSMYDCGLPSYRTPISWSWAVTAPLGGTGSITCLASKGI